MTDTVADQVGPFEADRATIESALESASIPTLLTSLIHLTGDLSILDGDIRPAAAVLGEVQGNLNDEQKAEVRRRALDALLDYRDRGYRLPPAPDSKAVHRMMSFLVGEEVPAEYAPMMMEELALDGHDQRRTALRVDASDLADRFHVLVIGAGMSGLLAAVRLQQAGVPYTVVEKDANLGGTWNENTYPGCRVDIANHFYCYSFEPNHDWSEYFSQQPELKAYFEGCADKYQVRDRIRFATEVVAAVYDEDRAEWEIELRDASGRTETLRANLVISGVGQLNRPKIPDIPGLDSFAGTYFHSARWRHDHDLEGRRVAVIGTGASALQLVPEVAKQAGQLYVLQRSPAWMFPNPAYHRRVSDGAKWLLRHVPYYARWYRFLLFWPGSDGLLPSLIVDPNWPHQDRSINELNELTRIYFTDYMKEQLEDRPDLLDKVVPTYPPFGKRMLQDNGSWLSTLKRDNVELVTDEISRIEPDAVVLRNGRRVEVDTIVFATGFHANKFLWPMKITGRAGKRLDAVWGDDPRAYLGITVPDFPNLFCLYGPATNLAHAGSIIFHSECQVRYVMGCIAHLLEGRHRSMECRRDVFEDFNHRLDEALAKTVWAHPGVDSWYKNKAGRVTTTSPWRLVDYWRWTKHPSFDDFVVE